MGFAVVLTLSLVSFVSVLLLSLAALVWIETVVSYVHRSCIIARHNAILGL